MLNLVEIEIFITIVESGSFRKAADSLFKTQPVISYHIKQLESYLGFSLFDRSQYRATLTKQGELFFPEAYSIFNHSSKIESLRTTSIDNVESHLSLSISSLYPRNDLIAIVKKVNQKFPTTTLDISIDTLAGYHKLRRNHVDIALSEFEITGSLYHQEFSKLVKMIPSLSSTHKLAKKKYLSKADLLTIPQIVLRSSGDTKVQDAGVLKFAKQWIVSEMSIKKECIEAGFGWGNLPYSIIRDEKHLFSKITVKPRLDVDVQLYKLRHKGNVGVVKKFVWDLL